MSVFRIEKTADYTVLSNFHFREKEMSFKAKGLLSFMLSLPNNWDYSVEGLESFSSDGKDSIISGLKELEKFGYLVRKQKTDEKGKFCGYDYIIYEKPLNEQPFTENPQTENPFTENPSTENPQQLNTNISNTNTLNTNILNTNTYKLYNNNNIYRSSSQNHNHVCDKNTDDDINEFFESVWSLYPKKTNKSQIRKATKKRLYKIGFNLIARCIERYKEELEANGTDYQYIKAGSTFFNGGYEDYLDDDWEIHVSNRSKNNKTTQSGASKHINDMSISERVAYMSSLFDNDEVKHENF